MKRNCLDCGRELSFDRIEDFCEECMAIREKNNGCPACLGWTNESDNRRYCEMCGRKLK